MSTAPRVRTSEAEVGREHLLFELGGERYALDILGVQEIIGIVPTVPVPQSPPDLVGVIDLRGRVVPIVDLRRRLELHCTQDAERPCIIILNLREGGGEGRKIGVVVDRVLSVHGLRDEEIEDPPRIGSETLTPHVRGVARIRGEVVLILDVESLFVDVPADPESELVVR